MICLSFHCAHKDLFFFNHRQARSLQTHTAPPWQLQCLAYLTGLGNLICVLFQSTFSQVDVSGSFKVKPPQNILFLGYELSPSETSLSTSHILRAPVLTVCCRSPGFVCATSPLSWDHSHYSSSLWGNRALRVFNRTRIHINNNVTRKRKLNKKENPLQQTSFFDSFELCTL